MPLPVPVLDNRTWTELTAEGRAMIPAAAPAWTDHNAHDPGITLMELFAWISEMLIFRLDRVSPAKIRGFLRLMGVTPNPPTVASTVVAFRMDAGSSAVVLPAGLQVADATGSVIFESAVHPIRISPAWIELSPAEGTTHGSIRTISGGQSVDHTADNGGSGFWGLGANPAPGDCLMLGFDGPPFDPGLPLSLYVWTVTWSTDAATRDAIERESSEMAADCSPGGEPPQPCDPASPAPPGHPAPSPPPPWWLHYSARTTWEYWAGPAGWKPLHVNLDQTRALTLSGFVRLAGPPDHQPGPDDSRYWLRCRLVSGAFECPPRLAAVGINALLVGHAAGAGPENLGSSRGQANQVYQLSRAPVVAGSTTLRLVDGGIDDNSWTGVLTWDRTGSLDHHYLLDPATGAITFGDGRVGFVPLAGSGVEMVAYDGGGGPLGNLPAGGLQQLVSPPTSGVSVLQPFDAQGGAPAESLDRAHGRVLTDLGRPARAVTAADFEALALEVPSVRVARAAVWPEYHPAYPCLPAAGVVTVVVLPACGSPPAPGPEFLAEVQQYLDRRRPLTTEVHVVGPTYVPVTVTATLHTSRRQTDLAARAQLALEAFFDPLTGGRDSTGWPFGRAVLEGEVMSLLGSLAGVDFVDEVGLTGADPNQISCVNLSLCPTELVASQKHRISVLEE